MQHGEPRFTRDIDVSLGVDSGAVDHVFNAVSVCGLKPLVDSPKTFVERTYILPVHDPATEIRVDFAFTFSPFEREAIGRALWLQIGGYTVAYATAEDVIIHKLFAGRPRDIEDIRGVLARDATCCGRDGKDDGSIKRPDETSDMLSRVKGDADIVSTRHTSWSVAVRWARHSQTSAGFLATNPHESARIQIRQHDGGAKS